MTDDDDDGNNKQRELGIKYIYIYIFFLSIKSNCWSSLKIVLFELRLEFIVLPLCWISNLDCEIIVHAHGENGDKRGIRVFSFLFFDSARSISLSFFPSKNKIEIGR